LARALIVDSRPGVARAMGAAAPLLLTGWLHARHGEPL